MAKAWYNMGLIYPTGNPNIAGTLSEVLQEILEKCFHPGVREWLFRDEAGRVATLSERGQQTGISADDVHRHGPGFAGAC
jgi:hypothetical protein